MEFTSDGSRQTVTSRSVHEETPIVRTQAACGGVLCWKPPQGVLGDTCQGRGVEAVTSGDRGEEPVPPGGS